MIDVSEVELNNFLSGAIPKTVKRQEIPSKPLPADVLAKAGIELF